jgi:hypothetical protein
MQRSVTYSVRYDRRFCRINVRHTDRNEKEHDTQLNVEADVNKQFNIRLSEQIFKVLLRVTWVASLFRGSLLGNSFVTHNKYWRGC